MAIEQAAYRVALRDGELELRDYDPVVLAETVVPGAFEEAGNQAFRRLFRYISGGNRPRRKVAMTAPVSQEQAGEKIAMTAPVAQEAAQDSWLVSFTMPTASTLETLPEPDDPQVRLRQVPARRMAALRYSGRWSESSYLKHRANLESWLRGRGLRVTGDPVWARYNSPFAPWFLRRNEILIPVERDDGDAR